MTLSSRGKLISIVASSIIFLIIIGVVLGLLFKNPAQLKQSEQEEVLVIAGFVDGQAVISRSLDLGGTWTDVAWPFSDKKSVVTSLSHDGVVFLASTNAAYCTSQNGIMWSEEIVVPEGLLSIVGEVNAATSDGKGQVVLGCVNGMVFSTVENGEQQWTYSVNTNSNATYAAFQGKKCAIAGMGGLYLTTNAGKNWDPILSDYVYDIVYAGSGMWAAAIGTRGVGIVKNENKRFISVPGKTLAVAGNKTTLLAGTDEGIFKLTPRLKPDDWENVSLEPISNLEWTGKHFVGTLIEEKAKTYHTLHISDANATEWTEVVIKPWPAGKSVNILALSGALVQKNKESVTNKVVV